MTTLELDAARRLAELGWLETSAAGPPDPLPATAESDADLADADREAIADAVARYDAAFRIPNPGVLDRHTFDHLFGDDRFCKLPDVMAQRAKACKWPGREVTWFVAEPLPGVSLEETRESFRWAFAQWAAACGMTFREVQSRAEAQIWAHAGGIDGPDGTLAWSQLPCGVRQVEQKYDLSERWRDKRFRDLVILHELGHGAIGLEHDKPGTGSVMEPTLNRSLAGLTPHDAARALAVYPRQGGGPPAPPPPPAPAGLIVIDPAARTVRVPAGWSAGSAG